MPPFPYGAMSVRFWKSWNGMKITYGGDTGPNKFFVEYAKGADIAIHESFIPVKLLMEKWVFEYGQAVNVGTRIHTSPAAWAAVMAEVKPKLAIAYHFKGMAKIPKEFRMTILENFNMQDRAHPLGGI